MKSALVLVLLGLWSASPPPFPSLEIAAVSLAADPIAPGQLPGMDQIDVEATSYVYRAGWSDLQNRLLGTTALTVIRDPQVWRFLTDVKDRGDGKGASGDIYRFFMSALHEELIMAGAEPARPAQAGAGNGPAPAPPEAGASERLHRNVAFVRPTRAGADELRARYDAALQALAGAGGKPETAEVGRTTYRVVNPAGKAPQVYTAWKEDQLVWAAGKDSAGWAPLPGGRTLADNELFRQTAGRLLEGQSGPPIAMYYYDLRPTWQRLTATPPGAAWNQVSWRSLEAMAGATFVEGSGYRNRHYWKVGPQRSGLFQHSRESRIDPAWLQRVPAEASGFTTGVWDAWSFLPTMVLLYAKMGGAEDQALAQAPAMTLPLQPLLGQVGPRYLVYRLPRKYGVFPFADLLPTADMVLITQIRDVGKFEEALGALPLPMAGAAPTVQMLGHKVRVIPLYYVTMYVALLEKEALVAFSSQMMADALENWTSPGPSILDTPAYKAATAHVLKDACFELYMPPGGFSRAFYDRYVPVLEQTRNLMGMFGGMGSGGAGMDLLIFPRGHDIARHVQEATILSARDEGEGVLFDGRAPVLCTPYYWAYFHALSRFGPREGGVVGWFQLLMMPQMGGMVSEPRRPGREEPVGAPPAEVR